MVMALTPQQFADLAKTTGRARTFAFLERLLYADFSVPRTICVPIGTPLPRRSHRGSPGAPWPIWPPRSQEPRCRGAAFTTSPADQGPDVRARRKLMAAERWMRASDQERDSAAELLSEAYAVGRLSREELDERVAAAYSAKTYGELRDLTADLPLPAARTCLPSETIGFLRCTAESQPTPDRPDDMDLLCARASGLRGRAGGPRCRMGGRDPDTHRAAADARAAHQQAAHHPRGYGARRWPTRPPLTCPGPRLLSHSSEQDGQAAVKGRRDHADYAGQPCPARYVEIFAATQRGRADQAGPPVLAGRAAAGPGRTVRRAWRRTACQLRRGLRG